MMLGGTTTMAARGRLLANIYYATGKRCYQLPSTKHAHRCRAWHVTKNKEEGRRKKREESPDEEVL